MKRFPLLFSIIGLLSLHLFFPAAFAQEQNSSPLMMLIGAHGEEKNLLSIPTHEKKELQSRNDDENNSSFVKREALSRGGPREIISEENNSSTSPKTSLSLANSMDNISSPLTDPTEIRNQTFSSASQEETKADSPDASFQGIPIAIEQQQLPSFQPDNDMGEGTWHHVPSSLPSDHLDEPALRRFVQSYNRAGQIQKRKKVYEEELKQELIKNLSPQREDRIFVLQKLLPL